MPKVVTLDTSDTQISTDKTAIDADGVESCTVYVSMKNTDTTQGEPNPMEGLRGSAVTLAVSPSTGVTITQPTGVADASGTVSGSFVSTNAATVTVSATALGVSVGSTTVTVGGAPPTPPPEGDPFYSTSFASGTVASDNDANGFTWGSPKNTAVVTFDSRTALRFRYTPGGGGTQQAEQRFNMGQDLPEVWIEYDLHIPANFAHVNVSPNNNKFFMIWNTVYGSGSGTWQAGYEFQRSGAASSTIRPMSSKEFGTNASFVTSSGLGHPDQGKAFIGAGNPLTPDAWHQIRLYFARSSAGGASDGVFQMWIDGTLFASMTNGPFRNLDNIGDTVLRNGYFMGTANALYTEQTDFHMTDVSFYSTDPGWS